MVGEEIHSIVIVGGGTAGWMAAAALSRRLKSANTRIVLIESEEIGPIGVGEATIPAMRRFNEMLGIDEAAYLRATKGTYKLGIEFVNWARLGDSYVHPFGRSGYPLEGLPFHQHWLRLRQLNAAAPLEDYCVPAVAGRRGRFKHPPEKFPEGLPRFSYAYHLDAILYGRYLRGIAERRGVTRIEGKVVATNLRGKDGFIELVALEDGRVITGDLFIDCSGFRGLLIAEALKTGFVDWSHWLPCNRALAAPTPNTDDFMPLTRATARAAGWQWRIPLQHRTGNGHVYCDSFMGEDEAAKLLLANIDAPPMADLRRLRFTAGIRSSFWVKNCIALGLAGGFLEPLESTSIYLVQFGIMRLLDFLPARGVNAVESDAYNRSMTQKIESIRDFLILHYKATERGDTPFWNYCRTMPVPDTLQHKMDLFTISGRYVQSPGDLFSESSWIAVMIGQRLVPQCHDPLADVTDPDAAKREFAHMQARVSLAVAAMPAYRDYLEKFVTTTEAPS